MFEPGRPPCIVLLFLLLLLFDYGGSCEADTSEFKEDIASSSYQISGKTMDNKTTASKAHEKVEYILLSL
jgi:hypothetical protein